MAMIVECGPLSPRAGGDAILRTARIFLVPQALRWIDKREVELRHDTQVRRSLLLRGVVGSGGRSQNREKDLRFRVSDEAAHWSHRLEQAPVPHRRIPLAAL